MNRTHKLRSLVAGTTFLALTWAAYGDENLSVTDKSDSSVKPTAAEIRDAGAEGSNSMPVPEPSATSLIFIGAGCAALGCKMRARA